MRVPAALLLAILAVTLLAADGASAASHPLSTCFWEGPISTHRPSTRGFDGKDFNFPESSATYWLARFNLPAGAHVELVGRYPHGRYMSVNAYSEGEPTDALSDTSIAPNPGATNPFVAVADLSGSRVLLAALLVAIVVQGIAANITNVYTAGLSLVNAVPALGRLRATALVAAASIALSALPDFVDHAQRWIVHLGNVGAPLAGVVVADYVIRQRRRIDVPALFDPNGPYRYLNGVNVAAVAAVAGGVGVYYAVPHGWVKVAWGVAVGGVAYLTSTRLWAAIRPAVAERPVALGGG